MALWGRWIFIHCHRAFLYSRMNGAFSFYINRNFVRYYVQPLMIHESQLLMYSIIHKHLLQFNQQAYNNDNNNKKILHFVDAEGVCVRWPSIFSKHFNIEMVVQFLFLFGVCVCLCAFESMPQTNLMMVHLAFLPKNLLNYFGYFNFGIHIIYSIENG